MKEMSTVELQIAARAREYKGEAFFCTVLANLVIEEPDAGKPLVRVYVQQRLVYSEG